MLVRQLVSVSNATIATAKNVWKLEGTFHMIENNVLGLRHVATMEAVELRIEEEVNGFFNGLDDLLSGRLTLSLVSESFYFFGLCLASELCSTCTVTDWTRNSQTPREGDFGSD